MPGLATSCRARLGRPGGDRLLGKPDRQAPALAQAGVVGRPIGDLMPLSRDMVTAVLVQLEKQGDHPGQIGGAPATPVRFRALPVGSVHHVDAATSEILAAWGEAYWYLAEVLIARESRIYQEHASMPGGWTGWRDFHIERRQR